MVGVSMECVATARAAAKRDIQEMRARCAIRHFVRRSAVATALAFAVVVSDLQESPLQLAIAVLAGTEIRHAQAAPSVYPEATAVSARLDTLGRVCLQSSVCVVPVTPVFVTTAATELVHAHPCLHLPATKFQLAS